MNLNTDGFVQSSAKDFIQSAGKDRIGSTIDGVSFGGVTFLLIASHGTQGGMRAWTKSGQPIDLTESCYRDITTVEVYVAPGESRTDTSTIRRNALTSSVIENSFTSVGSLSYWPSGSPDSSVLEVLSATVKKLTETWATDYVKTTTWTLSNPKTLTGVAGEADALLAMMDGYSPFNTEPTDGYKSGIYQDDGSLLLVAGYSAGTYITPSYHGKVATATYLGDFLNFHCSVARYFVKRSVAPSYLNTSKYSIEQTFRLRNGSDVVEGTSPQYVIVGGYGSAASLTTSEQSYGSWIELPDPPSAPTYWDVASVNYRPTIDGY
jgi:hypothetical protein